MNDLLLACLHPDERALLPLFQASIDDGMLREIAEADYGQEADECHALLREIQQSGVATSDEYRLHEVLRLTSDQAGLRGCWIELFACTCLLQLQARYLDYILVAEADDMARFVSNSLDLGEPVARAAAAMAAARYLNHPGWDAEPVFLAFAILLLAAYLERGEEQGPWLKQLAEWVSDEVSRAREEMGDAPADWYLGLTPFSFLEGIWRDLARKILLEPASPHPSEAREALTRVGRILTDSD